MPPLCSTASRLDRSGSIGPAAKANLGRRWKRRTPAGALKQIKQRPPVTLLESEALRCPKVVCTILANALSLSERRSPIASPRRAVGPQRIEKSNGSANLPVRHRPRSDEEMTDERLVREDEPGPGQVLAEAGLRLAQCLRPLDNDDLCTDRRRFVAPQPPGRFDPVKWCQGGPCQELG